MDTFEADQSTGSQSSPHMSSQEKEPSFAELIDKLMRSITEYRYSVYLSDTTSIRKDEESVKEVRLSLHDFPVASRQPLTSVKCYC
jgi:hypothetical protein